MSLEPGDWVEGKVQWWWKYVIPAEDQFWASVLAQRVAVAGPSPEPWRQASTLGIEGVAMLRAAGNISDAKERAKLLSQAVEKFSQAAQNLKPLAAATHG